MFQGLFLGTNVPRNGPGNECSREHSFPGTNGLENKGTGRYSDSRYSDKCFWKGATNT